MVMFKKRKTIRKKSYGKPTARYRNNLNDILLEVSADVVTTSCLRGGWW